ncbi:MAG: thioredoxin domain-containing protein [candidate division Zixibacteria bacterium]|nr:thioredoxin domain-containing protein [candidate division Zixibacteria bacterium]NIR65245.1 thioredoxin domain-containing protein [candidate division Zixibacteria bacterium]NIS16027.1 thioredoxin domain-containing protein [candidate division Zixibacteria bacterium]NIS46981.1 thioredoxin domain-containing protein [candidate division Zixibacteria bacterium]NIT52436.1 thioredoxin domain-containing protein [candidate division Zixibacteria bacterium]
MEDNKTKNIEGRYNRLRDSRSPYLLQHAENPVEWYPWKDEAFIKAKEEDKPIFLSIGYSTCHWCHVMAHESFEDEEVARMMNGSFVSIKVDREERPDIDNIYMTVCQIMTGSGGWPLTIIMTPDKKPFFAGTYIPKHNSYGRIGMIELIQRIDDVWKNRRDDVEQSADQITAGVSAAGPAEPGPELGSEILRTAYSQLESSFDDTNGGFGSAPKFPSPHNLIFLLKQWKRFHEDKALDMVEKTLQEMRKGGIYDHIGFGFHRYSTDSRWFLPHFEKMLYDQAIMAYAFIEVFQATGKTEYKDTAEEIFKYVKRDMTDPAGGFYSAEDADSEGEEGKFYLWTKNELGKVLEDRDAEQALRVFNVSATGNYAEEATGRKTGDNILHISKSLERHAEGMKMPLDEFEKRMKKIRDKLFDHRELREHPHKDDKILTDWNGLMIAAYARGAQVFDNPALAEIAILAADFILGTLKNDDGSLLHMYREEKSDQTGFIDDYAFVIWGLLELYEATFEIRFLDEAIKLQEYLIKHFWDFDDGGFYFTSDKSEQLIHRSKEIYDGAIPSGNSVSALNLIRLARITARTEWEEMSHQLARAFASQVDRYPAGNTMLLSAVDYMVGPSFEIVISGDLENSDSHEMLTALRQKYIPNRVIIFRPGSESKPEIMQYAEYTKEQKSIGEKATAYICQNFTCSLPTSDIKAMLETLEETYRAATTS